MSVELLKLFAIHSYRIGFHLCHPGNMILVPAQRTTTGYFISLQKLGNFAQSNAILCYAVDVIFVFFFNLKQFLNLICIFVFYSSKYRQLWPEFNKSYKICSNGILHTLSKYVILQVCMSHLSLFEFISHVKFIVSKLMALQKSYCIKSEISCLYISLNIHRIERCFK